MRSSWMLRLPYEAKAAVWEQMGYRPNHSQAVIHADLKDILLVAGGWRGGKSVVTAGEMAPHCLVPSPNPYLIALIGPTYVEPRAEFDYIAEMISTALPGNQFDMERDTSRPNQGPWSMSIKGPKGVYFADVRTYTASEAVSVRSFNADAVAICEAGGIDEDAFEAIMGRVLSTGGFVFGSGTLETAMKWYHDKIKEGKGGEGERAIHAYSLPSWTNTAVFEGGRDDPKIKRLEGVLRKETFDVRVGAEPIRVSGLALPEMSRESHVREVEFNPALPVELAIDPGYTGAYAVLPIQVYNNEIHIIDEVYERFKNTAEVIEVCKQRPWWGAIDPDNPGVIDRAAKQKQAATGDSVLDVWLERTGFWLDLTQQIIPVDQGLDQMRLHLGINGHVMISPKAKGLLAECDLGDFPDQFASEQPWQYRKDRSGSLQGDQALKGADHSCTALEYWLVHRYGFLTLDSLSEFAPMRVLPVKGSLNLHDDEEEYGPVQAMRSI